MTTKQQIPDDWNSENPQSWTMSRTADAFDGYHKTGAVYRSLQTISYSATDFTSDFGEDLTDAAQWWADILEAIVNGEVAIAEATPEEFNRARNTLNMPTDDWDWMRYREDAAMDLEGFADMYRKLEATINHQRRELVA